MNCNSKFVPAGRRELPLVVHYNLRDILIRPIGIAYAVFSDSRPHFFKQIVTLSDYQRAKENILLIV